MPGLLLGRLFALTVIVACVIRPAWGGERVLSSWAERFRVLIDLLPPLGIFLVVVGSIYAGFATPTEAASLGVVASLILAAARRVLTWGMLRDAIEGAMTNTAMVMRIILATILLNFTLATTVRKRLPTDSITGLGFRSY